MKKKLEKKQERKDINIKKAKEKSTRQDAITKQERIL